MKQLKLIQPFWSQMYISSFSLNGFWSSLNDFGSQLQNIIVTHRTELLGVIEIKKSFSFLAEDKKQNAVNRFSLPHLKVTAIF